jgi:hypothetical protein
VSAEFHRRICAAGYSPDFVYVGASVKITTPTENPWLCRNTHEITHHISLLHTRGHNQYWLMTEVNVVTIVWLMSAYQYQRRST